MSRCSTAPWLVTELVCLEPDQELQLRENAVSDELYFVVEGHAAVHVGMQSAELDAQEGILVPLERSTRSPTLAPAASPSSSSLRPSRPAVPRSTLPLHRGRGRPFPRPGGRDERDDRHVGPNTAADAEGQRTRRFAPRPVPVLPGRTPGASRLINRRALGMASRLAGDDGAPSASTDDDAAGQGPQERPEGDARDEGRPAPDCGFGDRAGPMSPRSRTGQATALTAAVVHREVAAASQGAGTTGIVHRKTGAAVIRAPVASPAGSDCRIPGGLSAGPAVISVVAQAPAAPAQRRAVAVHGARGRQAALRRRFPSPWRR